VKRKKKNTNIQLNMLIALMQQTEPDLFSEKLEKMPVTLKDYDLEDAWWDAIK